MMTDVLTTCPCPHLCLCLSPGAGADIAGVRCDLSEGLTQTDAGGGRGSGHSGQTVCRSVCSAAVSGAAPQTYIKLL